MRKGVLYLAAGVAVISPALLVAQPARYLDPRDVAQAQQEHAAFIQDLGGAETGPRALYVESVGRRIGAQAGIVNAGQALHYTTLNSPVENAFSVPGGYVYITRQLMTLMDDEAQLAFALGHETAHIAANHAHIREQYAERGGIFGVFGQIFGSIFGGTPLGTYIAQQSALRTLSFSRDQEYQADTLGLQYLIRAGYDPEGGPGILAALSRNSALQARVLGRTNRQTPEWASTHPLSENRMQRALQEARASGRLGTGIRNRDTFLSELDGIYVDDDPAQGVIDGPVFTHPDLRIQFQVPPGYMISNGTRAVTISGSAGKAQFSGGRFNGTLENHIFQVIQSLTGGQVPMSTEPIQRTTINGMASAFTTVHADTGSGVVDVSVVSYQWDPQTVYYFVTLTAGGSRLGPFISLVNSLRKISPAEAATIRPRVIDVVTVGPSDTVQSLASRMAYRDFKLDRFLSLNGLTASSRLAPGQKVKLVVYGSRRS
jgi:predicted Zn-dependent protease